MCASVRAFDLVCDLGENGAVQLLACPPGSRAAPVAVWTRQFEDEFDREVLLSHARSAKLDLAFLGRLTMTFGGEELDAVVDRLIADARTARAEKDARAADQARRHRIVHLYARANKRGHVLELQRDSDSKADWKVVYDRAIERDRLCDWMRWQKDRFLGFLDYAAEHGDEALTRLLTDEMFETERRVKSKGRGTGGMRPLRMWRGDQ